MLKLANKSELDAQLAAWCDKARVVADEAVRGVVTEAFNEIVTKGPQYSGDFVANTRIGIDSIDTTTFNNPEGGPIYRQGSAPAINYARRNAATKISSVKLGQRIFISTTVSHDGEGYAQKLESGIKFREANPFALAGPGRIYKRVEVWISTLYSKASGGINPEKLSRLRQIKL